MKLSKIFYIKTGILLFFMVATIVASYFVGNKFGYFLMGDIQDEEKITQNLEDSAKNPDDYSPLVNSRFSFNPSEFPNEQFDGTLVKKPDKEDVLEESPTVVMTHFDGDKDVADVFDLGENAETATNPDEVNEDEIIQSNVLHKVVLKTFDTRDEAERLHNQLRNDGYDPYIIAIVKGDQTKYRVQVAAFRDKDAANELAEELRKKNYNAWTLYETQ